MSYHTKCKTQIQLVHAHVLLQHWESSGAFAIFLSERPTAKGDLKVNVVFPNLDFDGS